MIGHTNKQTNRDITTLYTFTTFCNCLYMFIDDYFFTYSLDDAKLNWAFKLYDVDNDGMVDMKEISVIMETLDSIEGVVPG